MSRLPCACLTYTSSSMLGNILGELAKASHKTCVVPSDVQLKLEELMKREMQSFRPVTDRVDG